MRALSTLALTAALAVSCASPPAVTATTPSASQSQPTQTPSPTPSPTETPVPRPHVFVIVMENASLTTALRSPSIERLAATYALATNYHAVSSPSLPNYLALTSGSTWGITDNAYHVLPGGGIGAQLTAAGPYPYALKHNPFAYYGGACPENVVSLDALDADLTGDTPNFVWVTPGLCHDGHDCPLTQVGPWLENLVSRIIASAAWRDRGVLFIAWDEGAGDGSDIVPLIIAAPDLASQRIDAAHDHYSLLATIEDLYGLPRLGAAQDARALTDLLPRRTR
jgi:hypothetical protein